MRTELSNKKERALKKVKEIKGFYIHLTVFVLVNIFLITTTVYARMNNGEGFTEALFSFGTFSTLIFWGIGVVFHAAKVFGYNPIFSKEWEERQIQKYIEEDEREARKYK